MIIKNMKSPIKLVAFIHHRKRADYNQLSNLLNFICYVPIILTLNNSLKIIYLYQIIIMFSKVNTLSNETLILHDIITLFSMP